MFYTNNTYGEIMSEKYNFKDTIMDERLISEYKDEIKLEVANSLGIDFEDDAIITNNKINKNISNRKKKKKNQ